jgi:Pyruvate kinase
MKVPPIHTKIIATIGPSVGTYEKIRALVEAGVDVARLNFSHGTYEEHAEKIRLIKQVRKDLNKPIAIMLDTKGPEIRLGKIREGSIVLRTGQRWHLVGEDVEGNEERATLRPSFVLPQLRTGMSVLFADGYLAGHIVEVNDEGIIIEIDNGGVIKSNNNVSFPFARIDIPSVSDKDIADIFFGCEQDIDYIAASFVRCADDVLTIKKIAGREE